MQITSHKVQLAWMFVFAGLSLLQAAATSTSVQVFNLVWTRELDALPPPIVPKLVSEILSDRILTWWLAVFVPGLSVVGISAIVGVRRVWPVLSVMLAATVFSALAVWVMLLPIVQILKEMQ